ncbi:MAG: energy transducer TonB [Desulfobacterales bacterium]
MAEKKIKSNRLLQALICVSLGIHTLVFIHVSGIYRSHAVSYIELTLQDVSKPYARSIPRPRMRLKNPKVTEVEKVNIQKPYIPKLNIEPVDTRFTNTLMEDISTPDIPGTVGLSTADWNPEGETPFVTSNDYYEMIRLKIESCKRYPDSARARHMEGRAKIRFVITQDGQVSSVKIVKGARHGSLNTAAMNAVKSAAPFPKPPVNLFKGPLHVEITIVFELT